MPSEPSSDSSSPAGAPTDSVRPSRPGLRGALSALENSRYRWLFASNFAFFLAMGSQQIVRAWLAFEMTDSELALGLIGFTVAVPMFVAGPLGGVVADRRERRSLIAMGQAAVVVSEGSVLALLATGNLQFWHLLVASGVMGSVFPFIMPARQAIVANIVGKAGLSNAMALNMAGVSLTRVIGPAAGGFLIGLAGVEATYAVGITLYVIALVCLIRVGSSPPTGHAGGRKVLENLSEGMRYVAENRLVMVLLLFGLIPMFLAMPFQTLLVVFAEEIWQVGSAGLGMLSASAGIGAVVGSVYVAWRSDAPNRSRRQVLSMVGFGVFLLLFALCPWFWIGLPLVFLANVFASIYGTLNNTAIQLLIPDRVRGRISSFLMMSFSLPLLGTLPMSAIAELWGAPIAVGVASVLAVVIALMFYASSPALRNIDATLQRAMVE
ncbi:MAG: hypothetical protein CL910_11215 [Deltaproteobacteria bacterium]|jgi:MFS family permease|nr:hypothetical protein [Deltaproteobacteria bacterium]